VKEIGEEQMFASVGVHMSESSFLVAPSGQVPTAVRA